MIYYKKKELDILKGLISLKKNGVSLRIDVFFKREEKKEVGLIPVNSSRVFELDRMTGMVVFEREITMTSIGRLDARVFSLCKCGGLKTEYKKWLTEVDVMTIKVGE